MNEGLGINSAQFWSDYTDRSKDIFDKIFIAERGVSHAIIQLQIERDEAKGQLEECKKVLSEAMDLMECNSIGWFSEREKRIEARIWAIRMKEERDKWRTKWKYQMNRL